MCHKEFDKPVVNQAGTNILTSKNDVPRESALLITLRLNLLWD